MTISRKTLAAIHIAKKDRGLDDDSYRDFLEREAGVRSAADLDERGAQRVMLAFEKIGFEKHPHSGATPGRAPRDRRPIARKAVALWIMLHNLDEIENPSDRALDAFAKRVTGKDRLKLCTNGEVGKVVEALKDWCKRCGVDADTTHAQINPLRNLLLEQGLRLADATPPDWVEIVASTVRRRNALDAAELQEAVNRFGTLIRRLKLGRRHEKSPSPSQGETT